ncbi:MAG: hypothetical protein OQK98_14205 [Gammaproteobacteria bacterium]|nr:hypothetical protein [Gammaproteobacteria bacterium]
MYEHYKCTEKHVIKPNNTFLRIPGLREVNHDQARCKEGVADLRTRVVPRSEVKLADLTRASDGRVSYDVSMGRLRYLKKNTTRW